MSPRSTLSRMPSTLRLIQALSTVCATTLKCLLDGHAALQRHRRSCAQTATSMAFCTMRPASGTRSRRRSQAWRPAGRAYPPGVQREEGGHRASPAAASHTFSGEVAAGQQDARGQRQLGTETLEDIGEGRHHHHVDHADGQPSSPAITKVG
jgi:hypothetical protein